MTIGLTLLQSPTGARADPLLGLEGTRRWGISAVDLSASKYLQATRARECIGVLFTPWTTERNIITGEAACS